MFLSVTTSPITLRILGQSLLISFVLYHGEEKDDHVPNKSFDSLLYRRSFLALVKPGQPCATQENNMVEIKHCSTDSDFASAMQMTKDYIRWLNMDLSFQDIDKELSNFPSMYGPPNGLFLLAWQRGELRGGVGLRMLEAGVCEMKRLFVYDQFKRKGVGCSLCTAIIKEAMNLGYDKMRLDTLGHMKAAKRLYENLGFREIDPYRFNPAPTTKYMELSLR
jgi:putative acetyltransferase